METPILKTQKLSVFIFSLILSASTTASSPCLAHQSERILATQERMPAEEHIVVMRHAEKPDDPDDPNLTAAGRMRAQSLAAYIPQKFGRPDYIFAASDSKNSRRPSETASPLSQATGVPVDESFRDKDYKELAYTLLTNPAFAGKFIVVVWHHGKIPELAHALQAKDGTYPEQWDGNVYNQILQFDYGEKKHPHVSVITEPF